MRLLSGITALLYPPKCVLCGELLPKEQTDFCTPCRQNMPLHSGKKEKIPFVADWRAVWYYKEKARESLLRFKFSNKRSYAQSYGPLLAMRISQEFQGRYDMLGWVPVSSRRRRQRGYDQVELLAKAVCRELGIQAVPMLKKIRDNPPQSGISGLPGRKANVLGAYKCCCPDIKGKRVLLLDDIITTGATVSECAKVLLTAGAKEVICAAMAASEHQ